MTSGKWRVASDKWRVASDKWRVASELVVKGENSALAQFVL